METISKWIEEKKRAFKIFLLSVVACCLAYWFHDVYKIDAVHTHFFYVPIILASLWWKRKGIFVAFFLSGILLLFHIFFTRQFPSLDLIRSGMFIIVSSIIAILAERIEKTENLIRESEANFRALAENSNDGILIASEKGDFVYANKNSEGITGYQTIEISTKKVGDFIHDQKLKKIVKNYKRLIKGRHHIGYNEITFERKDHTIVPIEINVAETVWHSKPAYLIVVRDITTRKRCEDELREKQSQLSISEKNLKGFSQRILSIREEEKKKLSITLHDELGSLVVALSSELSIAEEEIKDNDRQKALKSIHKAGITLRKAVANLKKVAVDLMPLNLGLIGLPNALEEYIAHITKQTNLEIDFKNNIAQEKINNDIEINLFRIVQEALNNVIQHGEAKSVIINLNLHDGVIGLNIDDNGKGFDMSSALQKQGERLKIGIQGMRERVESLGGQFSIRSELNKGTEIDIEIPT